MKSFRRTLAEGEPKPKELMSVELDSMVSHSEESREQHGETMTPPGSPPRRLFGRCESAESSSSTDSSSGVSSGSPSPPPSIPETSWDPRLNLKSALHRMLTFPVNLDLKLRLDIASLAGVGFFWRDGRLECFKCGLQEGIIGWQDLTRHQIQIKHYDCTHPCEDDIPETRRSTFYHYEAHRLLSFYQNRGWDCTFVEPAELAKNGFYYTGRGDVCKCHFCKLEVNNWEAGDTPAGEHQKWNKDCPFLMGRPVGNFELGGEVVQKRETPPSLEIRPFARAENDQRPCLKPDIIPRTLNGDHSVYPEMKSEEARLKSFTNWPADKKQKPKDLAEAGFFYRGDGDECICFDCGGGLTGWEDKDEPWVMHAKWFSECTYLRKQQSSSFITAVNRVHKPILSLKDFQEALKRTSEELEQRKKLAELNFNSQPVC
ncbi:E3 ubiquitin-protein ligase XIAP-like isoform X1 [Cloeon dipterum]|uniref:E3 ubiquitin-protein ligase XIAP-like isoform X1 n=2 Tax=Cloeon dipterum TaxID=197152 RepID=UPI00321F997F